MKRHAMRIGAELRDSREVDVVASPWNGAPVGEVAIGAAKDIDDAIALASTAFNEIRRMPTHTRVAILERAARGLEARAAELLLGILASAVVMWFSRQREFRADAGGASLAGRGKMIAALERLRAVQDQPSHLPSEMAALAIKGGVAEGLKRLFLSHPPLEERIAALRAAAVPTRLIVSPRGIER